jgi:hypothetical protein
MLDWIRYHYKLWRFHAEKKKTAQRNEKLWRLAKQGKKLRRDLQGRDDRLVDDDISQITSDYLQRKAERLLLSVPEFSERSDKWEKSPYIAHFPERWRLTRAAMAELRSAIRAERKESSELAFRWATLITGILGTLIGLAAVILGRR